MSLAASLLRYPLRAETSSSKYQGCTIKGALEFINQLSKILGGLGGDSGMDVDISPARVRISQTLRFPPKEGDPLFIGPAQVINLALGWAVMIPLSGRDVLSVSFALSSCVRNLSRFLYLRGMEARPTF